MGYQLGVDVGTTFTAAALARGGHVEVVSLGDRTLEIPSVAFAREDGTLLVGEPALRRGLIDPTRFAREFKRRLGDHTPILLGGVPYSAEALMSALLRYVLAEVGEREGGAPDRITLTLPANWGPYKRDLFDQMIRLSDVASVSTATEPAAAAVHFASTTRVAPGDVIALYDLGGGTFDAAVLRKVAGGFELLGPPEGIEHLGGVDFDEAVFGFVVDALRRGFSEADRSDQAFRQGVVRLRRECVDAKQTLSGDTEAAIEVALPAVHTHVRLTRAEFEDLVRPLLQSTVAALGRALRAAHVEPSDVKVAVLAGGSSRIPLIAQLITSELGIAVTISSHPKHAVALGAALLAHHDAVNGPTPDRVEPVVPAGERGELIWAPPAPVAAAVEPPSPPPPPAPVEAPSPPPPPAPVEAPSPPPPPAAVEPQSPPPPTGSPADTAVRPTVAISPEPRAATPVAARRRWPLPILIAGAVAALIVAAVVVASSGGGGDEDAADTTALAETAATGGLSDPAAAAEPMVLEGHTDNVFSVAFSPDGERVGSGGADNSVRVWDAVTGDELLSLEGHEDWVQSVVFSPDGLTVASGSDDGTVRVWDAATGDERHVLEGHASWIMTVAFSPDGATLASGSEDGTVRIWDVDSGEEVRVFEGHTDGVAALAYSPDGVTIASGADNAAVLLWDAGTGEVVDELDEGIDSVTSVAFSPDGTTLAMAMINGAVAVWPFDADGEVSALSGHEGVVHAVAYSPNGELVATAGDDGTVRVWDPNTGEELGFVEVDDAVYSVAFSPDGERLAGADAGDVVTIWDVASIIER